MMFGQYCRIESRAGGVSCTEREFIRAALSMIKKRNRYTRNFRFLRHKWLREGLALRISARREYVSVVTGRKLSTARAKRAISLEYAPENPYDLDDGPDTE